MKSFPLEPSQYQIMHKIGVGSKSDVYAARCLSNNIVVAIKIIDMDVFQIDFEKLRKEVTFWATSEHQNMLPYYGSFVVDTKIWMLTEYMDGGSCRDILQYAFVNGFKDEALIATILEKVLQFLKYFHSNHQIHRDIRPGSILLTNTGEIKVGNLGVAGCLIQDGQRMRARYTQATSCCYSAPEMLKENKGYSESVDIWSLGMTAIELATGKPPYNELKQLEQVKTIVQGELPTIPDSISPLLTSFIKACIQYDPKKRPTASELLKHKFIKLAKDKKYISTTLMSQLLPLDRRFAITNGKEQHRCVKPVLHSPKFIFDFPSDNEENNSDGSEPEQEVRSKLDSSVMKLGRFTVSICQNK
ncbi:STE family protein kinase [Histomonas meleagridis]|uniref:STE family protein kinase n=1 Tax=Histomonas meleagridis TaxID=135588 RepID=UPI003559A3C3|nr:STE family protein kinase [Histomonas meleagridis]KAH0801229.1 STE family protein kinase [Histomonas meleagridis]